jgi:hypothetical protein
MENKFKYRPEIKSIEDLQPGDEFLVGDQRWKWSGYFMDLGTRGSQDCRVAEELIRANVPIERDIPYPEGGAEQWELREGDGGKWVTGACQRWSIHQHKWIQLKPPMSNTAHETVVYAIPKAKPQDKAKPAPKEYTVMHSSQDCGVIWVEDFKPGDRVTVQRVSEQGEPR